MPKTPHDALAIIVMLVSVLSGGVILTMASRRFTETQRATVADRQFGAASMLGMFVVVIASYYYAPIAPLWALLGALAAFVFAAYSAARQHFGQNYPAMVRALLTIGFALQLGGPLVAIAVRAAK